MPSLLIVDDDVAFLDQLSGLLRREYDLRTATTVGEAKAKLAPAPDAVLLDVRLSEQHGDKQGLELLDVLCESLPDVPVVMMTSFSDVDVAVECMQRGALDFIQKSRAQPKEIKARLAKVLQAGRVAQEAAQSKREIELLQPGGIVANSLTMIEVKRKIAAFANGRINVLIRGETGTGKELVAKAIHKLGPRSEKTYKRLSLSTYAPAVVESEIFGHVAGAYTDAQTAKVGVFEQAKDGVLFLDEIGEISLDMQIKLLRVLQEREFERMGGAGHAISLNVQFVFATNANLEQKIADKTFREDFLQRINTAVIWVPPLRERPEDIPLLVDLFLKNGTEQGSLVRGIVPEALDLLTSYEWPGNVRQLENSIESASALAESRASSRIEPEDLESLNSGASRARTSSAAVAPVQADSSESQSTLSQGASTSIPLASATIPDDFNVKRHLAQQELTLISQALKQSGNGRDQRSKAAALLGYGGQEPRFALRDKLKQHANKHPELVAEFPDVYKDQSARE